MARTRKIGGINTHYGNLRVKKENGKCYWAIENYDGNEWERITEELYKELLKHKGGRETHKVMFGEED